MKKIMTIAALIAALLFATACEVPEDDGKTAADRALADKKKSDKGDTKTEDKGPKETVAQENARESAETYLDVTAYSREGLIKQLKFEGYSEKDAIYGVDAQHANWNNQAAASAQTYLDITSYSRDGLIQQLMFEGFTRAQAEYGVKQAGL